MNLFQLECFLAVAECLNFARAAESMNITQPSITHQIRSLETELNTRLFHRTTRTVALTAEGRIFLPFSGGWPLNTQTFTPIPEPFPRAICWIG